MNVAQAQALGFATILGTAAGARRAPAFGQAVDPAAAPQPGPPTPVQPSPPAQAPSILPWWGWMILGAGALGVGYVGVRYAKGHLGRLLGGGPSRDERPDLLEEYAHDPRSAGVRHVPSRERATRGMSRPIEWPPKRDMIYQDVPEPGERDRDAYRDMYDFNEDD